MMKLIHSFVRDERGEDLIEYGLLAAFVAAVAVFVLVNPSLRLAISAAIGKAVTALGSTF
jgi:Flp pilus assembly pilin Flp